MLEPGYIPHFSRLIYRTEEGRLTRFIHSYVPFHYLCMHIEAIFDRLFFRHILYHIIDFVPKKTTIPILEGGGIKLLFNSLDDYLVT